MIAATVSAPRFNRTADHLDFLRRRAENPAGLADTSRDLELVATCGAKTFWEMVGLRLQGHAAGILGALEFRRQVEDPDSLARQSLAAFLSSPPRVSSSKDWVGPSKLVALQVPRASESIAEFLSRLGSGSRRSPLLLDPDVIEVAFDFRTCNPSLDRRGQPTEPVWQTVALRTNQGHVLTAALLDMRIKLCRQQPFLAFTRVVQHMHDRVVPLPTVFLHRSFIAMMAPISKNDLVDEWTEDSVPFCAEGANSSHLLDPRL